MATKRKRATRAPSTDRDSTAEPIELVVRRGALWRFNILKKKTADLPVRVLWDRRQSDRRGSSRESDDERRPSERRASDRRQNPPFTWELADFVVVGQAPPAVPDVKPTPAKPRKKKSVARVSRPRKS